MRWSLSKAENKKEKFYCRFPLSFASIIIFVLCATVYMRDECGGEGKTPVPAGVCRITVDQMRGPKELFEIFEAAARRSDGNEALLSSKLLAEMSEIPWKFKGWALLYQAHYLYHSGIRTEGQIRTIFEDVADKSDRPLMQDYARKCINERLYGVRGVAGMFDLFDK